MTYIVKDECIKCKLTDCVEVCPVDCFYEGENMLVIHPDECIDCGVCEPECPAEAIIPDVEPEAEKWLEMNRAYSEKWPNVTVKSDPLAEAEELSKYSQEYDVFINTSYLDYFPNRCKNGYLSVFFPGEIFLTPWELIKRKIVIPSFKNFFIYPTEFENFSHDTYKKGIIYKWLTDDSSISFSSSTIRELSLEIFFPTFAFSGVESLDFRINGKKINPVARSHNHNKNTVTYRFNHDKPITSIAINNHKSKKYPAALVKLVIPTL